MMGLDGAASPCHLNSREGEVRDALDRGGRGDAARQPGRGHQRGARRVDRDAALGSRGALVQLKVAGAIRG
jgi:hypothetical protein